MTFDLGAVRYRNFERGDGSKLAEAWSESAPSDPMSASRFRDLILLDRNFDREGLRIAELDGDVVGASYAVHRRIAVRADDLEPGRGWIPFFFVRPSWRGNGIGESLVRGCLEWLANENVQTVRFSDYTPNYFLPGLDADRYPDALALLEKLGFSILERPSAMDRSLIGYQIPTDVAAHIVALRAGGWYLGSPTDDDLVDLIALAGERFNEDWARAIREGILQGMPLDRIIMARSPEGRVAGWAMHATYDAMIDRFGPFGVEPDFRGTGLGKALLHLTLERMKAQGAHSAWFLWADEGTVASRLYVKTGFVPTRTFSILEAQIPRANG